MEMKKSHTVSRALRSRGRLVEPARRSAGPRGGGRRRARHRPRTGSGGSSGGPVAYEMAYRLKQMGDEIGLLALLDSWPNLVNVDLDDDILQAAKEVAANRRTTAGRVISDWVREALEPKDAGTVRNGVPVLPRRPGVHKLVTMDEVNRLRDEE